MGVTILQILTALRLLSPRSSGRRLGNPCLRRRTSMKMALVAEEDWTDSAATT